MTDTELLEVMFAQEWNTVKWTNGIWACGTIGRVAGTGATPRQAVENAILTLRADVTMRLTESNAVPERG